MTTPVGNSTSDPIYNYVQKPNAVNGVGITTTTLDVSKLSPEEREKAIERIGHVTIDGLNCGGGNGCYPPGYYTNNWGQTVKKRVVVLTNDYIKKLEGMLDSEDSEIRQYAASEVVKRLDEDKTRYNHPSMNALVNKMLLDPYCHKVREKGLNILDNQLASGDENTKLILEQLKNDPDLLDRDRNLIETCLMQMATQTTIVNAPVVSSGRVVS